MTEQQFLTMLWADPRTKALNDALAEHFKSIGWIDALRLVSDILDDANDCSDCEWPE